MKTGINALYLTLALIGANGCSPAHATQTNAKPDAVPQISTRVEKPVQQALASKASEGKPFDLSENIVSINTGSAEDLARIMNGVGLKKAQSIVNYREEFGPFKELDQLQEVPGIGGALVERNRKHIKL
jgi:competence protein ComEA